MANKLILFSNNIYIHKAGCEDDDVKLVDGSSSNEGRVEICLDNQWGTVTSDGWSTNNAKVVCRQLGYSTDGERWMLSTLGELLLAGSNFSVLASENIFANFCTH